VKVYYIYTNRGGAKMKRLNQKRNTGNVEYWVHWAHEKPWFEVPREQREKYIHACKMVYTDSTKRQYFMWGGDWQGIHPICWCGHAFDEYDIMTPEEFEEWKKRILSD
jgi:hypothetical protein